jgi:hypothetical protein
MMPAAQLFGHRRGSPPELSASQRGFAQNPASLSGMADAVGNFAKFIGYD